MQILVCYEHAHLNYPVRFFGLRQITDGFCNRSHRFIFVTCLDKTNFHQPMLEVTYCLFPSTGKIVCKLATIIRIGSY